MRLEPASLVELMTAYVTFLAISEKRIALDDTVTVSRAAFAAPGRDGARMFIEPGRPVTVQELLRGMIIVSADDAAVALAEHAAGSQAAFVDRMNAEATAPRPSRHPLRQSDGALRSAAVQLGTRPGAAGRATAGRLPAIRATVP